MTQLLISAFQETISASQGTIESKSEIVDLLKQSVIELKAEVLQLRAASYACADMRVLVEVAVRHRRRSSRGPFIFFIILGVGDGGIRLRRPQLYSYYNSCHRSCSFLAVVVVLVVVQLVGCSASFFLYVNFFLLS